MDLSGSAEVDMAVDGIDRARSVRDHVGVRVSGVDRSANQPTLSSLGVLEYPIHSHHPIVVGYTHTRPDSHASDAAAASEPKTCADR